MADVVIAAALTILNEKRVSRSFLHFPPSKRKRSDDLPLLVAAMVHEPPVSNRKAKISGYVERIVPMYSDQDFKSHFRLSRGSVEYVVQLLHKIEAPLQEGSRKGRAPLEVVAMDKAVLASLWLLGNQESFRSVADRFGLGVGHTHRVLIRFCKYICGLRSSFIKWPDKNELYKVNQEFNDLRGWISFPGVAGAIDGTLVQVTAKKERKQEYYSRKQFTAVVLQGVSDASKTFLEIFAGWPGSSHDARVWHNSPLCLALNRDPTIIPESMHLLGDSAYPLSTSVMVPFRDNGHLTRKQKLFNKRLSSTRVVVEQAFGDLFGRFRRLKLLHVYNEAYLPLLIVTSCVLHNICIAQKDDTPEIEQQLYGRELHDLGLPPSEEARSKRENLADYLFALCAD